MLRKIGTTDAGAILLECGQQDFNAIQIAIDMLGTAFGRVPPESCIPNLGSRSPDDQSRAPVRRAARKTNRKAKAARPADGARTCVDCKQSLPAGSAPQRLRCEDCNKIKKRNAANAAYHAKHAKKTTAARLGGTPSLPGKPNAASASSAVKSSHVSDAARKIAALREAREIERDRLENLES